MKTRTILFLLALLASAAVSGTNHPETAPAAPADPEIVRIEDLRPVTAKVVGLDRENDIVTVETASGFLFAFEGCSDYCEGDYVSAIMHTNGTPGIKDDYFVTVHYSGWSDYADNIQ